MAETTAKKSFLERVKESLKLGDDRKLVKFQKGVVSWCQDQIKGLNARIEKNSERIEDAEEAIEEYLLAIDFDSIKDTNARDEYISKYINGYDSRVDKIEELKEEIEMDQVRVERRKALINRMS